MSALTSSSARFRTRADTIDGIDTDLLIVPVSGPDDALTDCPGLDAAVGGEWSRAIAAGRFGRKPYSLLTARVVAGYAAAEVCFLGVGDPSELDPVRWRRLAAVAGYEARQRRARRCAWLVRTFGDATTSVMAAQAAADGLSAAEFDIGHYRTDEASRPTFPSLVEIVAPGGAGGEAFETAVDRGRMIGCAVNAARRLAGEPANVLTPTVFADRTRELAADAGLTVEVLDEQAIRQLRMGLLLAVAQGSAEPPQLAVLRHEPAGAPDAPLLALVGKGVTFDTGGVSIKRADGMDRMKADMGGGAAVAAAMWAIGRLRLPCRVIGLIPMVENMLGGRAFRPGDVFTAASGKTVEVLNTDAEGRLILADALWYAGTLGATHLVDVATLTGHVVVGLGHTVAALMGKPANWVEVVRRAAADGGDRVWPLPIYEEALEQLTSEVADLTNVGGSPGGAITAAAFLREFAGDRPWAHLDIAGTAWAEAKQPYQPKGPTGSGVRTLVELATTVCSGRARTD